MAKKTRTPRRAARERARARLVSAAAVRIVLTTSKKVDAPRIAEALVAAGFAACVNVLPGARSTYRWRGKVERASEALLVIKTTRAGLGACVARLAAAHPYEVPEALVLTPGSGLSDYVEWVARNTRPSSS